VNGAASDNFGIHAAIAVAKPAHQRVGDIEVARRAFGIDVDSRAADDPLYDLQADISDGERLVEQVEFVPGRPAADIQIGAKSQRMDLLVDDVFDRPNAG